MKAFSNFFVRISNWKSLLFCLTIYMIFPAYILKNAEIRINELAQKEVGIIDLTVGFNPQQTLDMVAAYGDEGRAYYAQVEWSIDVVYPLIYATLFAIILTLLFKGTNYIMVNILPFLTVLFDYIENTNTVTLLYSFPDTSYTVVILCESFKLLKWLSLGVIVLILIWGIVLKTRQRLSKT